MAIHCIRFAAAVLVGTLVSACGVSRPEPNSGSDSERVASTSAALTGADGGAGGDAGLTDGETLANLQLKVSENACAANLAQDYFQVTNGTSAPVRLADISIKYWINDTSGIPVSPQVAYGGCVTTPNGTCIHPVSGVTATATPFAPACGPSSSRQANWEITIATTDTTPVAAGNTWSNLQTGVNLSTHVAFSPGTSTWFSACGSGGPYAANSAFAVYDQGNWVVSGGAAVPSCRAPEFLEIQNFIDSSFYSFGDIVYSFEDLVGNPVDCIGFNAQHSVQALRAKGLSVATVAPPALVPSPPVPPANVNPAIFFDGQPDPTGKVAACPAGSVPTSRPTVAQVEAVGGIAGYQAAAAALPHPQNVQALQNDCWLNAFPDDNTSAAQTIVSGNYEHAAGILTGGFAGPNSSSFSGVQLTASVYASTIDVLGSEHNDSQLWVQTGTCENWWNNSPNVMTSATCPHGNSCTGQITGQQCPTGGGCTGPSCAVQSLETGIMTGNGVADAQLFIYFTSDGYGTHGCYAGTQSGTGVAGNCCNGGQSDCFVRMANAPLKPWAVVAPQGTTPYGVKPQELGLQVQFDATNQAWWVYVSHAGSMSALGYYPASLFQWDDGSTSQMAQGTATYLQAGGEVADAWPNGQHTSTSMVSDRPAWEGYQYAAYQRNVVYFDGAGASHSPSFDFLTTGVPPAGIPVTEGDLGIPGLCGLDSAGWADSSNNPGAYSITSAIPAGGANWGEYFYFGGGRMNPPSGPELSGNFPQPVSMGAGGEDFACAINPSGGVECWGDNSVGELGNGTQNASPIPVPVSVLTSGVTAVAAGTEFACALQNGAVYCWGDNIFGELGIGGGGTMCVDTFTQETVPCAMMPTLVTGLPSNVTAISAGNSFACALTATGAVWCWGDDESGALGDNRGAKDVCTFPEMTSTPCSRVPIQVQGLGGLGSGATGISAGNGFACALGPLGSGGKVECWGIDNFGEVGAPSTTTCQLLTGVGLTSSPVACTPVPTPAQGVSGAIQVFTDKSGTAACVITQVGGVLCWGDGGELLGNGSPTNPFPAVQVQGLTAGVTTLSIGNGTYCAVQTGPNAGLVCWGAPNGGFIQGSLTPMAAASPLTTDPMSLAIGGFSGCVLDESGALACWGAFTGNGGTQTSTTPVLAQFP